MKISPSTFPIIAGLLVVGTASAFVPNSCNIGHGTLPIQNLPSSISTTCFASEVDTDGTSSSSSSPTFPFSDRQVRFAYDEWRLIYDKGDYDPKRFESFKANHRTLVMSNLKAREKAAQDGRPIPQWMSLNEYGDCSMDEYEAMLRGEQPKSDKSTSYSTSEASGTQAVHNDYSMNYSNGQVSEYQDAFGRTIRSTEALNQDQSLESSASKVNSNYANNIDDDENSRGTIIIPKGENDGTDETSQRGTQVIGSGSQRGTQVVSAGSQRGTQVIGSSAGAQRGTQVNASANGAGSQFRGTQVISGSANRGTQVLSSNSASASYGTQVVRSADQSYEDSGDEGFDYQPTAGTQIIPKNKGGTQIIPKGDKGGTQVLSRGDIDTEGGTKVLEKSDGDGLSKFFGILFGDSEKDENSEDTEEISKRETMVIKRSIKAPEQKKAKNPFDIFGSSSTDEEEGEIEEKSEEPRSNDFFGFLSPKDESTAAETAAKATEIEEESNASGGIFSLFGGNVQSSNPRPVRSSISLQKQKAKNPTGFKSQRKTKLIPDKAEEETGVPSILSFFGGAKKVSEEDTVRNPNSRPTLILKQKPQTNQFSSFFASKKPKESSSASIYNKNPVRKASSLFSTTDSDRGDFQNPKYFSNITVYFFHFSTRLLSPVSPNRRKMLRERLQERLDWPSSVKPGTWSASKNGQKRQSGERPWLRVASRSPRNQNQQPRPLHSLAPLARRQRPPHSKNGGRTGTGPSLV